MKKTTQTLEEAAKFVINTSVSDLVGVKIFYAMHGRNPRTEAAVAQALAK